MSQGIGKFIRRNIVGLVAIFIALNAGAYAATIAPPNSVVSSSIKDGQVKAADIRTAAVTNPKLANGAVSSAKLKPLSVSHPKLAANAVGPANVADNSLTGSDINESTLGTVPSANSANSAFEADRVDNVDFASINYRSNADATKTEVLNFFGLILRASCPGGLLSVEADTTANNRQLNSSSSDAVANAVTNGVSDDDFDAGDNDNLLPNSPGGASDQVGHTEYSDPALGGSGNRTVVWQAEIGTAGAQCMFSGYAFG